MSETSAKAIFPAEAAQYLLDRAALAESLALSYQTRAESIPFLTSAPWIVIVIGVTISAGVTVTIWALRHSQISMLWILFAGAAFLLVFLAISYWAYLVQSKFIRRMSRTLTDLATQLRKEADGKGGEDDG
jgi:hypothetical protein